MVSLSRQNQQLIKERDQHMALLEDARNNISALSQDMESHSLVIRLGHIYQSPRRSCYLNSSSRIVKLPSAIVYWKN